MLRAVDRLSGRDFADEGGMRRVRRRKLRIPPGLTQSAFVRQPGGHPTVLLTKSPDICIQPSSCATTWLIMMTADPLSATFGALADPTRRAILARLATGEASVKELAG